MSFQMSLFFCSSFTHFQHLKFQFHFTLQVITTSIRSLHKLGHWLFVPFLVSILKWFLFSTKSLLADFKPFMHIFLFSLSFHLFWFHFRLTYLNVIMLGLFFNAGLVLSFHIHFYAYYFSISTLPILLLFSALTNIISWSSLPFSISLFASFHEVDVLIIQNMLIVVNVHFICFQTLSSFYQVLIRIF